MGGKGRKRREKNYRAAHGGFSRLPPQPDPSKVDALPSKLRKLISLTSSLSQESAKDSNSKDATKKRKIGDDPSESKSRPKDEVAVETVATDDNASTAYHRDDGDDTVKSSTNEKRKKKRKRDQVKDLRFAEALEKSDISSKRREKRKKYLEKRKNKQKDESEDKIDFPGREKIKFGDIVEAPPKLVTVPKAFKSSHDASQERIRLKAIEEYRKRRGWTSRPGLHIPSPATASAES